MASLSGQGPHQTWKELLRVDNDPTRNQGVTPTLQKVADGAGVATALSLSQTAASVAGSFTTTGANGAISASGNISGLGITGTSLSVGPSGQASTAAITNAGALTATSVNAGSGAITGGSLNVSTGAIVGGSLNVSSGAISGGSVNVGSGTVTGGQFTGNAATVTNGVYQNSTYFIGSTPNVFNRAAAAQTLAGVSITGDAGTVAGLAVHTGRNSEANKIVRTDVLGNLQCGYLNSSNGDENNSSSPPRIWGTNGNDNYLRSYNTSYLDVGLSNGSWTPVLSCTGLTITHNTASGYYTRTKGTVTLFFRINFHFSAAGNTNQLILSGFPFSLNANYYCGSSQSFSTCTTPWYIYAATATAAAFYTSTGANYTSANTGAGTAVTAAKWMVGTFEYQL